MKGYSGISSVSRYLKTPLEDNVKSAELKMCAALVEHNIPFRCMDHFSEVLSSLFCDSEIAKKFSCKRTKARCLTYNVLVVEMEENLKISIKSNYETISDVKYALIIDESTDISIKSILAIIIKYSSQDFCIKTVLDLVEVKTSEGLFNIIYNSVTHYGLKLLNLIGFLANTTNVMFGEHSSVVQKLREVSPNCMYIKCVCHSILSAVSRPQKFYLELLKI